MHAFAHDTCNRMIPHYRNHCAKVNVNVSRVLPCRTPNTRVSRWRWCNYCDHALKSTFCSLRILRRIAGRSDEGEFDMGSLNEHNISLWVGTSTETNWPTLTEDIDVDVAVIGGGITGLSAAAMLKRRGVTVAVIEAGRIASGATGYTTAKVTSLHGIMYADLVEHAGKDQAQMYADANEAAIEEVAKLVDAFDIDCDFRRADAYSYTIDPNQVDSVRAEVDAALSLGLPASFTETTELPYSVKGAVRFTNQAMFHPRKYCLGLADAIDGDGSHIYEMTRALDVRGKDICEVQTTGGTVRAGYVVMATQLPFLDRGGFFAKTHPARSYAMAVELNGPAPENMYLSIDTPTRSVRSHTEGETNYVIIGGEGHKVGQDPDTDDRYEALEAWAREQFDVRSIAYRWSAQDYMPVDDVPYIGPITSDDERILVATGFKKWGMTTGAVAGMILTDTIMGIESPWQDVFDSTRTEVRRSAKQFLLENANVAKRMIGDRLRTLKVPAVDDLKPGEGGVVDANGEKVGAYRTETGGLHMVSPVCTHLGCQLTWNTGEKSWDCPCHGSRFSYEGDVLQGPATKNLEQKPTPGN